MVSRHVVTLANSIVGVSVLAMPFCFKQCGIVLATLSLMIGAVMTRMVCYFLVKAALMNRRRTYELLAWSTFGQTGKLMVEIGIIGFLIGTLIAFMVVIGDLGPEILSEIFSMENNSSLRTIIMTALSLFVALPLGLLRNIDSLSSVSTASVLFYLFLLIKIFSEGIGPLWSGEYLDRIHFWRSGGVLQCIPIFSMALSCQTQIFGIYDALPDPSLQKMNEVVKQAVNLCTFFYFCVGFFGYIAFSHQNFGGNILLSFTPTWSTQLIKSMFLMSVVFSVPLVIFPCRVSLHSLIFKSVSTYHHVHDMSTNYIPESRMKFLTVTIVAFTLVIGIIIPNIELVLGLVGSTTGSVICIIFPSIMFVKVTSKSTTEKLVAQAIFCIGVVLMLLTTYATLYAAEQSQVIENMPEPIHMTENLIVVPKPVLPAESSMKSISKLEEHIGQIQQIHHVEYEPKIPEKMISNDNQRLQKVQSSSNVKVNDEKDERKVNEIPQPSPSNVNIIKEDDPLPRKVDKFSEDTPTNERAVPQLGKAVNDKIVSDKKKDEQVGKQIPEEKKPEHDDAARKEVIDQKMDAVVDDTKKEFVDKNVAEAFLKRLEEHQENQKKLLEEQKEILQELKEHHAQDVKDKLEKDKQKDDDATLNLPEDGLNRIQNSNNNNEVKKVNEKADVHVPETADKLIKEQEKIIEKISENIEKENKNAQLLEKLEEGLNNEVRKVEKNNAEDTEPKVIPSKDLSEQPRNMSSGNKQAELPNKIPPRETLKGIDKERGVLVGSLGSSRREPEAGDKAGAKPVRNKVEPVNVETRKDMQSPPNVKTADDITNNQNVPPINNLIQKTNSKNSQKVEISKPEPSKKAVLESKPKEKVDREI